MCKKLLIERTHQSPVQTMGRLSVIDINGNEYVKGVSLELAWKNNAREISCIPAGIYKIKKRYSAKHKNHFHVLDVPGREMILVHPANYVRQLQGCIAPGSGYMDIDKDGWLDVINSRITLNKILAELDDETELIIIENFTNNLIT